MIKKSKNLFLTSLLFFIQAQIGFSQQGEFQSPAGTKFLLYTPPGYATSPSKFPLLLSLHSKGETSNDITELTSKNPEQMPCRLIYLNRWPKDLPFIVLTPQLKPDPADPEIQWSAEYIDEVVRYVMANYKVDLARIYVTGISRGGTGAWTYAAAFPEKVAALLPLSGRSDLSQACPIKDIPIWAFHGDGDGVAPPTYSVDMINAVKACQPSGRYKPRLNILNARNHNGWSELYNGTNGYKVFEWLLKFKKNDHANKTPYVNAGIDQRIAMRSQSVHIIGDFFDSDGNINTVQWKQTGGTPLTLSNTDSEFLKLNNVKTGSFEFELTVTDNDGARNSDKVLLEIVNASTLPVITDLILINGKTNTEIGSLSEVQVINKNTLGITEINIKAMASDGTASVRFRINADQNTRTLNSPGPYLIKSQTSAPEWAIKAGEYLICATPYSQTSGRGNPGISQCFKVTVTDGDQGESCPGTGEIGRELWTGITGTSVSSIPVNSSPSSKSELSIFEGPSNIADNYGARVRGYICPPFTGNYTFWISSDDKSELWLSSDDSPVNKVKVAYASGATGKRQWDKFTSQKSAAINLIAGRKYYVEALHKEGTGYDHLAVGWQLSNGALERPIPGKRLSPFIIGEAATSVAAAKLTISQAGENGAGNLNIFPNPLQGGTGELTISGYEGVSEKIQSTVQIISMTGEIVYFEEGFCEANCNGFLLNIHKEFTRGVYLLKVTINGKRFSKKLLVK